MSPETCDNLSLRCSFMLQTPLQSGAILALASIFLGPVSDFFRRKRSTFAGLPKIICGWPWWIPHPIVPRFFTRYALGVCRVYRLRGLFMRFIIFFNPKVIWTKRVVGQAAGVPRSSLRRAPSCPIFALPPLAHRASYLLVNRPITSRSTAKAS